MALLASDSHMSARQREVTAAMIEVGILPTGRVMTGSAIRTKLSIVCVIPLMAGIAVCRRALELLVDMARLASYVLMLAFQFERRKIVVEFCGRPAIRCVTIYTAKAEATSMRLVGLMTGIAVLQRYLEIPEAAGIDVALYTGKTYMFARDFE